MRKKTIVIIVLLIFTALGWTFIIFFPAFSIGYRIFNRAAKSTERGVFVTSSNLESEPGIRILDANNPYFQVLRVEPNRVDVKWAKSRMEMKKESCSLSKLDSPLVHIMARLNDKEYPIVIDSGCPFDLVVNDMIVRDNKLEIFPFKSTDSDLAGFCHVDKIQIGDLTITNPKCSYTTNHYEKRVSALSKWKERQILFGLGLLHKFRYFLIDSVTSEVEFSLHDSFKAEPVQVWHQYHMSIEKTEQNTKKLMIHIKIAGEEIKANLDTGTEWSLAMSQNAWNKLSVKFHVLKESKDQARFFNGWKNIKKITVKQLSIGDKSMTDASIIVFNDSLFGENFIIIGVDYFKNTVVVIDFERNLIWVRKPQSS